MLFRAARFTTGYARLVGQEHAPSKCVLMSTAREGFRGGPLLDAAGTLQLLNTSHVRKRDRALLSGVLVDGVWNAYLLERVRGQPVPCRFCGPDGDGHPFLGMRILPVLRSVKNPEFHDLMRMDKGHWPRCLLLAWLVAFAQNVPMPRFRFPTSREDSLSILMNSRKPSVRPFLLSLPRSFTIFCKRPPPSSC